MADKPRNRPVQASQNKRRLSPARPDEPAHRAPEAGPTVGRTKAKVPRVPQPRTVPDFAPMQQAQGKRLMSPSACVSMHPFAATLKEWEHGVPVDCGTDWSWETIRAAVEKGAHSSATTPESIELIAEDVAYQVAAGYAEVYTWAEIQERRPSNLKVSPLAVVPQRNRRGRMILDLSFAVRRQRTKGRKRSHDGEEILQESVNDSTRRLAPEGPVKELGNVLPRILDFMHSIPAEEHIYFSKVDLADGYWRMIVDPDSRWNFAYVMPSPPGTPLRLVVPSALQMGWNESPAYFCATTETVRDIAQVNIENGTCGPPHPMEAFTTPLTPARKQSSTGGPKQMVAVYVDDFLSAAVENAEGTLLRDTARATLHAIHSVFPPPCETGDLSAKDPISEKKLEKGDARWATTKEVLGYIVDGVDRTIQLPPSRAADLLEELKKILRKDRVPLKRFRSIAGRLQHAARILPAARSFFTPINDALRGLPQFVGLGRHSEVREALLDIGTIIKDLARRPTHVSELVQGDPDWIGYCDASAFGAGGVWFGGRTDLSPLVWRVVWPPDITRAVISSSNPAGTLTNSDLELAGLLLHYLVLEDHVGPAMAQAQLVIGCDNSPAVAWSTRMATRSESPIAFRLLKGLAMRQRTTRAAPPAVFHVAGTDNTLADVASRRFTALVRHQAFANCVAKTPTHELLTIFNSSFPLPQSRSWTTAQPNSALLSSVISTLRGQRLGLQPWMTRPDKRPGQAGPAMHGKPASIPTCGTSRTPASNNPSLPLPPGCELASSGTAVKLATRRWKRRCVTYRKPSFWLATPTHDGPTVRKNSTSRSATC